jgi:aldehyde dehydrogenase (NAD+)
MDILKILNLTGELYGAYAGDGWHSSFNQHQLISCNPASREILAKLSPCQMEDCEYILQLSEQSFHEWKMVPAAKRGELIRLIAVELRKLKAELGRLISMEMGKSLEEGLGEVQEMIDMADLAIGQSRMLYGNTMHSERECHRLYEQWQPIGVNLVITSFNFPMAVWAWNAFIAAVCGNTVIWKPSSKTPLCAIAIAKICQRVFVENQFPAVFSLVIPQERKMTDQMIDDRRIALVSFTGSTDTGRIISQKVSHRLGRCLLELGGNNAIIIDESANLKLAIPAVVFGAVGTAGQRCTTTRRLFIHEKIYDKVVQDLISAYQQIKIGDPLQESNHMGPLIDQSSVDLYVKTIDELTQSGAKILFGGHKIGNKGYYVAPTLITHIEHFHPIVQRETFAPILYVFKIKSVEEAIGLQNQVRQGLSSSLFSNNQQHIELFLSASGSDCGIANINLGTSGAEITGAFGGEKDTGGGREAGSDAWKSYMRRQTVTINWGNDLPLAQGIQFNLE